MLVHIISYKIAPEPSEESDQPAFAQSDQSTLCVVKDPKCLGRWGGGRGAKTLNSLYTHSLVGNAVPRVISITITLRFQVNLSKPVETRINMHARKKTYSVGSISSIQDGARSPNLTL